jgi:DEAD/DEAH box helicase domain-containing protein
VKTFASSIKLRYHTHPRYMPYPAGHVSIRGIEEERYTVVDISRVGQAGGEAKVLEEVELSRALFEVGKYKQGSNQPTH